MTDQPLPSVHAAWAKVMGASKAVAKASRNKEQGYNFRGIDAVVNQIGPILRTHKVFVIPTILTSELSEVLVGRNRTPMGRTVVTVEWTVYGPTGDSFTGSTMGEAMDSGDKATTKAQTVAWRVFLIEALALPTGDRDPDHDTFERAREEVKRDWVAQAKASNDYQEVRTLYTTARAGGASAGELEEIAQYGETLAPKDEKTEEKTEEKA